jgi:hypothetical protein
MSTCASAAMLRSLTWLVDISIDRNSDEYRAQHSGRCPGRRQSCRCRGGRRSPSACRAPGRRRACRRGACNRSGSGELCRPCGPAAGSGTRRAWRPAGAGPWRSCAAPWRPAWPRPRRCTQCCPCPIQRRPPGRSTGPTARAWSPSRPRCGRGTRSSPRWRRRVQAGQVRQHFGVQALGQGHGVDALAGADLRGHLGEDGAVVAAVEVRGVQLGDAVEGESLSRSRAPMTACSASMLNWSSCGLLVVALGLLANRRQA